MFVYVLAVCVIGAGAASFPGSDFLAKAANESHKLTEVLPELYNCVKVSFQNTCISDLGCFYTGPPFYHPTFRPKSCTPIADPRAVFTSYTPSDPQNGKAIEPTAKSLEGSLFHPDLPIVVLIHGYRTTMDKNDIRFRMKDALLKVGDYNVIIADWSKHNQFFYEQAVANARVVAAELAELLQFIMEYTGIKAENIHLVGHSLGAHVAGWTGERIPNLGRITGLDPAGPYFHSADKSVRLDPSDALFVDIIHTDGGTNFFDGLGILAPVGHMDFYPNGGSSQPGCYHDSKSGTPFGSSTNMTFDWPLNTCDHGRACEYFLESIDNSRCRFLATPCDSYDEFLEDSCSPENSFPTEMGFHAKKNSASDVGSRFFLKTNEESPFCIE